jgi:MinD superfamily P-loop ATPase
VQELVVLSGKGGTGKTSLVASFAALAGGAVVADCDVDAADLHLLLAPEVLRREEFSGGSRARIDPDRCAGCGKCRELCRFDAISAEGDSDGRRPDRCRVDPIACEGCGVCAWFCPQRAIAFGPVTSGEWFVSNTRFGPMTHARLRPGAENSGKLVSVVRGEAKRIAAQRGLELVLVDGSPGIGCPVIASVTGADLVLAVTEPTLSGLHDLGRVADLTSHFKVETLVAVNKWDVNPEICAEVERWSARCGIRVAGRVRYDRAVTDAQVRGLSVVEHTDDAVAEDVRRTWQAVGEALDRNRPARPLKVLA